MSGQNRLPAASWSQRVIRNLLYGQNVDRAAKARVRVGFVEGQAFSVCHRYVND